MPLYTIEFIDREQNACATVDVEGTNDAAIIQETRRANVLPASLGFDIREGERVVHKYRRE